MTWRHLELGPERFERWWEKFHADHPGVEAFVVEGSVELRSTDGSVARFRSWYPVTEGPDLRAQLLRVPPTVGLLLIRRGGFSVGIAAGGELLAHKTGTRYVQSRTSAGGWSQQRYARRRSNQASALVEAAVSHAREILAPLLAEPGPAEGGARTGEAGVAVGGDGALVRELLADRHLAPLRELPHREFPDVHDPRFRVLQEVLGRCGAVDCRVFNP